MKKISIDFEPGEVVYIKPIQEYGRVNYVYINLNGTVYNINYFMNGDQKTANLPVEDLEVYKGDVQ